ncbi:hypothetical protein GCM10009414_04300 [Tatumella terrea]
MSLFTVLVIFTDAGDAGIDGDIDADGPLPGIFLTGIGAAAADQFSVGSYCAIDYCG